jgi:SH3-like domain-containing protein
MSGRRIGSLALGTACLVGGLAVAWTVFAKRQDATADTLTTAAITKAEPQATGPSGLPLPRFVSLKAGKVNVRRGPSSSHQVAWIFQRKGLPVEIVAESENWRRVRDSEGAEGWVLQNMLSGKRTVLVAPWRKKDAIALFATANAKDGIVARLAAGVVGTVENCTGEWCAIDAEGYRGFAQQSMLWGVYPDEQVSD